MKRWEFTLVVEASDNDSWLHDLANATKSNVHVALKDFLADALAANGVPAKLALVEYQETFNDNLTPSKSVDSGVVVSGGVDQVTVVETPSKSPVKSSPTKKK